MTEQTYRYESIIHKPGNEFHNLLISSFEKHRNDPIKNKVLFGTVLYNCMLKSKMPYSDPQAANVKETDLLIGHCFTEVALDDQRGTSINHLKPMNEKNASTLITDLFRDGWTPFTFVQGKYFISFIIRLEQGSDPASKEYENSLKEMLDLFRKQYPYLSCSKLKLSESDLPAEDGSVDGVSNMVRVNLFQLNHGATLSQSNIDASIQRCKQ